MMLNPIESPRGLEEIVLQRVTTSVARQYMVRKVTFFSLSLVSLGFVTSIGSHLYDIISVSGFFEYVALGFSDTSLLFVFSRELILSLIESIPIISLALFLASLVAFLWSGVRALSVRRRILTT
jgi:hypothetical protein